MACTSFLTQNDGTLLLDHWGWFYYQCLALRLENKGFYGPPSRKLTRSCEIASTLLQLQRFNSNYDSGFGSNYDFNYDSNYGSSSNDTSNSGGQIYVSPTKFPPGFWRLSDTGAEYDRVAG